MTRKAKAAEVVVSAGEVPPMVNVAGLAIEYVPISELQPMPGNPRRNAGAVRPVADSIKRFGWTNPILARRADRVVVAGHTRIEAAKHLGVDRVPVIWLDLDPVSSRLYNLADNKLAELAEWDEGPLAAMLWELAAEDRAGLAIAGFGDEELERLLNETAPRGSEPDDIPEEPETPWVQPGDLFALGRHRLLCGDSTKAEDVARLMDGQRAGLMNTDPPYGVAYANDDRPNPGVAKPRVAKPRVAKDDLADEKLQAFLEAAFRAATGSALLENAAWYLWHAHLTQGFFAAAAAAANVILHRQIIWVKPVLLLGRGLYHWKHEPCFMGWVEGNRPPDYGRGGGERDQTTIWEIAHVTQQERREFNHSTPKPVALFEIPMVKHLQPGEIAFEPFSGSGPQIIAAEQTSRRCFALELEPRYVQVAIERWEKFTGKKAEKLS